MSAPEPGLLPSAGGGGGAGSDGGEGGLWLSDSSTVSSLTATRAAAASHPTPSPCRPGLPSFVRSQHTSVSTPRPQAAGGLGKGVESRAPCCQEPSWGGEEAGEVGSRVSSGVLTGQSKVQVLPCCMTLPLSHPGTLTQPVPGPGHPCPLPVWADVPFWPSLSVKPHAWSGPTLPWPAGLRCCPGWLPLLAAVGGAAGPGPPGAAVTGQLC